MGMVTLDTLVKPRTVDETVSPLSKRDCLMHADISIWTGPSVKETWLYIFSFSIQWFLKCCSLFEHGVGQLKGKLVYQWLYNVSISYTDVLYGIRYLHKTSPCFVILCLWIGRRFFCQHIGKTEVYYRSVCVCGSSLEPSLLSVL